MPRFIPVEVIDHHVVPLLDSVAQLFYHDIRDSCHEQVMLSAIEYDYPVSMLEWLLNDETVLCEKHLEAAALVGNLQTMQWLALFVDVNGVAIMNAAATHGSLDNMKWLESVGCSAFRDRIFEEASAHGNLELLEWLWDQRCPIHASDVFRGAFRQDNEAILDWIRSKLNVKQLDDAVMVSAVSSRKMNHIKWACKQGCDLIGFWHDTPTNRNRMKLIMQCCEFHQCSVWPDLNHLMADCSMDMLQYLLQEGYPFSVEEVIDLYENGDTQKLQWCLDKLSFIGIELLQGWQSNSKQPSYTFPFVQWLYEKGIIVKPTRIWKQVLCEVKIDWDILQFLARHYPTASFETVRVRSLEMAQRLESIKAGCLSKAMYEAMKFGNLDLVKWLRQQGYPWPASGLRGAIESDNLQMFHWAKQHGCTSAFKVLNFTCLGSLPSVQMIKAAIEDGYHFSKFSYQNSLKSSIHVAKLVKEHQPELRCHGLTSAAIENEEDWKWLQQQGQKFYPNWHCLLRHGLVFDWLSKYITREELLFLFWPAVMYGTIDQIKWFIDRRLVPENFDLDCTRYKGNKWLKEQFNKLRQQ